MKRSLAMRLLVPIGCVLALAIGGTGIAVHHLLASSIESGIATRLHARLAWLAGRLEFDDGTLEFEPEEVQEPASLAESWAIIEQGPQVSVLWQSHPAPTTDDGHRQLTEDLAFDSGPRIRLKAGTDIDTDLALLRRTDLLLACFLPLAYLAAMAGIWFVVRRETRPLARMAQAANGVDSDQRSDIPTFRPTHDTARETDDLGRALDAMLTRLVDGLVRERQFAAAAAHELRTPLAQLITGLEVALRRDREVEDYRLALGHAKADAQRMAGMVDAILRLVRNEPIAGLETSVEDLNAICNRHGIAAITNPAPQEGATIPGNHEHWQILLANLIDNAQRHGGDKTEVQIELTDRQLCVSVSDHGPGVPPSDRERIFRPLVRLDDARTIRDDAGGYGLGLAIVANIVRMLNGTVSCTGRDDAGPGACFRITIPLTNG